MRRGARPRPDSVVTTVRPLRFAELLLPGAHLVQAGGVQTIPRVLLGEALKQLRHEAGVSLDSAAQAAGKDRPRLVKVLDGSSALSTEELEALVDFLGAQGGKREELLNLGVEARKRATGTPYMDLASGAYRRIAWLEAMAKDVWMYEKGIYPSLIQSPEYMDAVLRSGEGVWWEETGSVRENLASFRLERQRLVFGADPPKQIELMFTDDTFLAERGCSKIARGQVEHTLIMLDRYPNLTVRIVPAAAPCNPAQQGGLTMLRFGDILRPVSCLPVVYGPSIYFDQPKDTERILRGFNRLRDLAWSPQETRVLLERQLEELS